MIFSLYNNEFDKPLNKDFAKKAMMEGISEEAIAAYADTSFVGLNKAAIDASDAIIMASETINPELEAYFKDADKPKLDYQSPEEYIGAYSKFYDEILESTEVLQD